jgi:hypothetical protein
MPAIAGVPLACIPELGRIGRLIADAGMPPACIAELGEIGRLVHAAFPPPLLETIGQFADLAKAVPPCPIPAEMRALLAQTHADVSDRTHIDRLPSLYAAPAED